MKEKQKQWEEKKIQKKKAWEEKVHQERKAQEEEQRKREEKCRQFKLEEKQKRMKRAQRIRTEEEIRRKAWDERNQEETLRNGDSVKGFRGIKERIEKAKKEEEEYQISLKKLAPSQAKVLPRTNGSSI
jgi:hypothetical protein